MAIKKLARCVACGLDLQGKAVQIVDELIYCADHAMQVTRARDKKYQEETYRKDVETFQRQFPDLVPLIKRVES